MNKVKRIAPIFKDMATMAVICEVTHSAVNKWMRNNHIPMAHHMRLYRACPPEWALELKDVLESCVCKCCGQEMKK